MECGDVVTALDSSGALCDEFTRSALVESGDSIAALQNESQNGG